PVVAARSVVVKVAPPPAPPRFEQKMRIIQENRGAPVSPGVATQLAMQQTARPETRVKVRAASSERAQMRLSPKRRAAGTAVVDPGGRGRGRGRKLPPPDAPVSPQAAPSSAPVPPQQLAPPPAPQATPPPAQQPQQSPPSARQDQQRGR